jgi:Dehydrogenases with different specificities (related to short-chain alcohol dehydrogenases)
MTDEALGQVALVTGGSRGIGRAIAEALGKRGVKVAINWVTNELAAQKTLEEVRTGGGNGATYQADVASEREVGKMVTAVESDLGPIDMLVTSAGIMEADGYQQLDLETFQQVMRVKR